MVLPRMRSPRGSTRRRVALWSALAMGSILPSVGCQVEYAGMTLPSGRYMHDDVQYFPSGPDFPWANTQAATQRARMRAMGIEPPAVGVAPVGGGALDPTQGQLGNGRSHDEPERAARKSCLRVSLPAARPGRRQCLCRPECRPGSTAASCARRRAAAPPGGNNPQ